VLAVLPFAWRLIPHCGGENKSPYDIIGSVQIMAGLVGCIYALKELSNAAPSFTALAIAAAIGVVSLWLFVRRQRRARYPMIDFSLFQNRLFAGGVGVALVSMIALVGVELVLTQRLQLVLELTPLQAALFILPIPLASALAGPLTGLLLPRFGERSMILGGFTLTGLGIAGLALLYQSSLVLQLICLFIAGFGLGAVITAASTAIMLNAPEEKSGMAASIEDVSYELGGVLGITLLGGLMTAIYSHSLALPDSLPVSDIAYDSIDEALRLAANLAADQAEQLKQLARLAFDRAFIVVLIAAATLMALGAGVAKMALRK
jgi:DHA2 family multidrug resistance protein-like MFS transporter